MNVKIWLRYSQVIDSGEDVVLAGVIGMRMHSDKVTFLTELVQNILCWYHEARGANKNNFFCGSLNGVHQV